MAIIDQQREENYQEYLRLLCDSDYNDVTFDEKSGGVSAVHILHHFDKQTGPFGTRRGDYEIAVVSMLRNKGYRILLLPEECKTTHLKSCDCLLNDCQAEIKTVDPYAWKACAGGIYKGTQGFVRGNRNPQPGG